jgi:hypothetical protein
VQITYRTLFEYSLWSQGKSRSMMHAKVVCDNINADGTSERLTVITNDLLTKMGFKIDLASFTSRI